MIPKLWTSLTNFSANLGSFPKFPGGTSVERNSHVEQVYRDFLEANKRPVYTESPTTEGNLSADEISRMMFAVMTNIYTINKFEESCTVKKLSFHGSQHSL